ncbi:hypothetical protein BJX70DRAFT_355884 [Aspergillus crustosus]
MEARLSSQEANLPTSGPLYRTLDQVSRLFSNLPEPPNDGASTYSSLVSIQTTASAPSIATNNTTVPSTVPTSKVFPPSQPNPFRDNLYFPKTKGTRVSLYPHGGALISDAHYDRFRVVVDLFRQNVEDDVKLKPWVKDIDYDLRICGRSPQESVPSIVVFCPDKISGALNSRLTSPHLRAQYAYPDRRRFPNWRSNSQNHAAGAEIPRFKLYIWRGMPPRTLLWRRHVVAELQVQHTADAEASEDPFGGLTMCGSKITSVDGSCSTITCLVQVDSTVYGLTVGHAFSHLLKSSSIGHGTPGNYSDPRRASSNSQLAMDDHDFEDDDIEYEPFEEDDFTESAAPLDVAADPETSKSNPDTRNNWEQELCSIVVMDPDNNDLPDLDWALVHLSGQQSKRPNFYLPPENLQQPILLHRVVQQHPGHERDVLVVRLLQDARPGTLLRGTSFLGGINRPGKTEVWRVAFGEGHGLKRGDSGSLVVDRVTHEIYGYVVALNPLGEAYVMPMMATMAQIHAALSANFVSLPDPCSVVRDMGDDCTSQPSMSRPLFLLHLAAGHSSSQRPTPGPPLTHLEVDESSTQAESIFSSAAEISTVASRSASRSQSLPSHTDNLSNAFSFLDGLPKDPIGDYSGSLSNSQGGISVFVEANPNEWQYCDLGLDAISHNMDVNVLVSVLDRSKLQIYEPYFEERFRSLIYQGSNGAFHCAYNTDDCAVTPIVSWASYMIPTRDAHNNYAWSQPSIHIEWDHKTGRQLVFLVDLCQASPGKPCIDLASFFRLLSASLGRGSNPFTWHAAFAREIMPRYSSALWVFKNQIPAQDEARRRSEFNESSFLGLQATVRRLSQYSEMVHVAEHTLQAIIAEQRRWGQQNYGLRHRNEQIASWVETEQSILYEANRAHSLQTSCTLLMKLHESDVNMAFNVVSQSSRQSVSQDTQSLKTVAFLVLVFMPAIFISSIFGMSFFSFEPDGSFTTPTNFWIYWAVTIPLTIMTIIVLQVARHPTGLREMFFQKFPGRAKAIAKAKAKGDSDGFAREEETGFARDYSRMFESHYNQAPYDSHGESVPSMLDKLHRRFRPRQRQETV